MIPIQDINPRRRQPIVTVALIALNIIAFIIQFRYLSSNELWRPFADTWAIIPRQLVASPLAEAFTVFSAMFLHGGIAHLGGNMLYLWIFGDNIEDKMGHVRFLVFYLVCGIAATLAQVYIDPSSNIPNIGASGAIAGVLGGYFLLFPMAKVNTMIPILFFRRIQLPAVLVLGAWFALQLLPGYASLGSISEGGVAYWAHIGGFVAGVLLVKLFGNTKELDSVQMDYFQTRQ